MNESYHFDMPTRNCYIHGVFSPDLASSMFSGRKTISIPATNCKASSSDDELSLQWREGGISNISESTALDVVCPIPFESYDDESSGVANRIQISLKYLNLGGKPKASECRLILTSINFGTNTRQNLETMVLNPKSYFDDRAELHSDFHNLSNDSYLLSATCSVPPKTTINDIVLHTIF